MQFGVEKNPGTTNQQSQGLRAVASPATSNASTISLRRTCEHTLKRCAHMSHLILGALLHPWGELATSSERIHICTSLFEVVSPGAQDAGEVFLCVDRFAGEVGGAFSFWCHFTVPFS